MQITIPILIPSPNWKVQRSLRRTINPLISRSLSLSLSLPLSMVSQEKVSRYLIARMKRRKVWPGLSGWPIGLGKAADSSRKSRKIPPFVIERYEKSSQYINRFRERSPRVRTRVRQLAGNRVKVSLLVRFLGRSRNLTHRSVAKRASTLDSGWLSRLPV